MPLPTEFSVVVGKIEGGGVVPLGNGFYMGQAGHVVTTRQVAGYNPKNMCVLAPRVEKLTDYQDDLNKKYDIHEAVVAEIDPVRDLVLLKTSAAPGFKVADLGVFAEVKPGETVAVAGFPHALRGKIVMIGQSAELGAKVSMDCVGLKLKHGLLNLATTPIQSGSGVFELKRGLMVGVLMGCYSPAVISAATASASPIWNMTSYFISSEYIKEMV